MVWKSVHRPHGYFLKLETSDRQPTHLSVVGGRKDPVYKIETGERFIL